MPPYMPLYIFYEYFKSPMFYDQISEFGVVKFPLI
jgi:hypothetical protein